MSRASVGYKIWWLPIYVVTLNLRRKKLCVKICVCSFALLQPRKAVMFMSVRSFLALHLCWQPTALLQFLQSSKPAAALAGMPFLIPSLHPLSPPSNPPAFFPTSKAYSHQTWVASKRDKDWILMHDYKYVVHALTHARTLSSSNSKQPASVLKTSYLHWSHLL